MSMNELYLRLDARELLNDRQPTERHVHIRVAALCARTDIEVMYQIMGFGSIFYSIEQTRQINCTSNQTSKLRSI